MMKTLILLLPISILAIDPFESPQLGIFDTSIYDTKESIENTQAIKNVQIKCRYVCDRKIYKEQKISEAVEFYKKTRNYDTTRTE